MRFILSLFLCFYSSLALGQEVKFALNHWPPYSISDDGQLGGIDLEIAQEIARRMDFVLSVRKCPFKRCLTEMEKGALDLQSGIARNQERAKYMSYADQPYHQVSVVFHVRKGESERLKSYQDLERMRVGMVAKSHYFDPFNGDTSLTKMEVAEERLLLPMLVAGRIDTYVGTDPNASYDVLTRGYKDKLELAAYRPGVQVPVYFAISRKSFLIERLPELSRTISMMHEDGTIQTILNKYR